MVDENCIKYGGLRTSFLSRARCQNSRGSAPGNSALSFWDSCLKMASICKPLRHFRQFSVTSLHPDASKATLPHMVPSGECHGMFYVGDAAVRGHMSAMKHRAGNSSPLVHHCRRLAFRETSLLVIGTAISASYGSHSCNRQGPDSLIVCDRKHWHVCGKPLALTGCMHLISPMWLEKFKL